MLLEKDRKVSYILNSVLYGRVYTLSLLFLKNQSICLYITSLEAGAVSAYIFKIMMLNLH